MKLQIKHIIFSGFITLALFGSCKKDFLNLPPYTSIDEIDALKTDTDLESAITGTYAGLRSADLYGRSFPIFGEVWADNVLISSRNSGRYTDIYHLNFTINSGWFRDTWINAYRVINRANKIIDSKPTGDEQAINQYKGEAHAIRAMLYFDMVRLYARPYTDNPSGMGLPLVLKFDIDAKPERSSVDAIYKQVLADLDQANTLITKPNNSGRITKYAVRALQARVNLHKGDAASNRLALDIAKDVIDNSGVKLVTLSEVDAYWKATGSRPLGIETLFEVVSDQIDNAGFDELPYFFGQLGYGDGLAYKSLYDLYSDDDVRKNLIQVGVRAGAENPAHIIMKYPDLEKYGTKKILRISEVYLTAAEAAYKLNQEEDARKYLAELLKVRDPSITVTESGTALFEKIILERRKELAFEGDRFHTLNRLKRDITGRLLSQSEDIPYANHRRVAPIPQEEMDRNDKLKQNDGWVKN